MKQGWEIKKLGEICKIEIGKTPSRSNHKLWDKEKTTENVWLSIRDLSDAENKVISDSREYVSDKGAESLNLVKKGTLLVSFKLTLGRLAFTGKDLYTNEAIASLSIKDEKEIDKNYLYQYLSFFDWDKATKGDVKIKGKTLNKAKLKEVEIVIPPLSEQKEIVAILDKAFVDIEKAKVNAEKNLQNSKELFESYLQSVFNNKGDGWEEKTLGLVYDVRDGTHDSPKYQDQGFPLITSKNLKKDLLNYNNVNYISEKDFLNINKRSKVDKGDVLFAMIGTIGNPVVIQDEPDFAIKNVALFKVPETQNSYFLKYYLDSKLVVDQMMSDAKGTTQKFVGLGYLRDFKIKIPPIGEQVKIVKKLDELSAETKKLEGVYEQKLKDLEELKKGILQKAFSGQLTQPVNKTEVQKPIISPYIRNQVHTAILTQVLKDGGYTTEVAIVKYDYLLQEVFGLNLGYEFQEQTFGPFDSKIKKMIYSGLSETNKWFSKRNGMIVLGNNSRVLLSKQSNLYKNAQSVMLELSKLGITKMNAEKVELLATVCHSIKNTGSINFKEIKTFMSTWNTNNDRTKAEKFLDEEILRCLDFIVKNNWHKKLL